MTKFSVIIPVYNVEKYLSKCLDSVLSQTYTDFEVICVNDGSKDNSAQILDEYAKKDKRIKIINQNNQGVSVARNTGIKEAIGDYIIFVDSDDKITSNMLELLSKKEDFDICVIARNVIKNAEIKNNKNLIDDFIQSDCNINFYLHYLSSVVWDKVFKRDFLIRNNLYFEKNIHIAEDGMFSIKCGLKNPILTAISEPLYVYILREGSASNSSHRLCEFQESYDIICNLEDYKCAPFEIRKNVDLFYTRSIVSWYKKLNKKEKAEDIKYLNNFMTMLQNKYGNKIKRYKEYKKLYKTIYPYGIISRIIKYL